MAPSNFIYFHRMNEQFDMLFFEFDNAHFALKDSNYDIVESVKEWKCVKHKCIT